MRVIPENRTTKFWPLSIVGGGASPSHAPSPGRNRRRSEKGKPDLTPPKTLKADSFLLYRYSSNRRSSSPSTNNESFHRSRRTQSSKHIGRVQRREEKRFKGKEEGLRRREDPAVARVSSLLLERGERAFRRKSVPIVVYFNCLKIPGKLVLI